MLLTETISRTWQCDGFNCPTGDVDSVLNPFYSLSVSNSILPFFVPLSFDLCDVCIQTITAPVLVQDIANAHSQP